MTRIACIALVLLAACGEVVDVTFPDDYQTWGVTAPGKRVVVTGNPPGHSNSYRVIYADQTATDPAEFVIGYPEGSTIVKEIYDLVDGEQGELKYLALMRRVGPVTEALEDEGGWLFTSADRAGEPETTFDFCWNRCHVVAPYNGAWYDYRQ